MSSSDFIALLALAVSLAALFVSIYAAFRSNKNSSAATMVTLYEAIRQAWHRTLRAGGEDRDYELAELMNLLEIACALHFDKALVSACRHIMSQYLEESLRQIERHDDISRVVNGLINQPNTFEYIGRFKKQMRARFLG